MFLCTADVHLTSTPILGRPRLELGLQLLDDFFWLAEQHHVRDLFMVGDLVDSKNKIQKETLIELYLLLEGHHKRGRVRFHWIRGNHEAFDRAHPENSLMTLYSGVCDVITKPAVRPLTHANTAYDVYCLPWYPAELLKRYALELAHIAHKNARPKVLLFHAALREGRMAFSNVQIPQRVNGSDLVPDTYDMCLGGDYHMFQQLRDYDNIFYLSAPIPHTFGDEGNKGPWLVDLVAGTLDALDLPNRYPQFHRWTLLDDGDLSLPGYRAHDYNRIFAPDFLQAKVQVLYPDAQVLRLQKDARKLELSGGRLGVSDVEDLDEVLTRWMDRQGVDSAHKERYHTYGKDLLKDA